MTPAQLAGLMDGMNNQEQPPQSTADEFRALARMKIGGKAG